MHIHSPVPTPEPEGLWPGRIRALAAAVRDDSARTTVERADADRDGRAAEREARVSELWRLLNLVLNQYIRAQARRFGGLDADQVADVAADKALDLMSRIERRDWDPAAVSDAQVCAFLGSVARNGVVDVLRRRRREVVVDMAVPVADGEEGAPWSRMAAGLGAESAIDGTRYAHALLACAGGLTARARRAWVMRIFGNLAVAQIARHPRVATSLGGAHLMLNRARRMMRRCMEAKGFEVRNMPAGTFVALWDLIESDPTAGAAGRRLG
jgi:DNA-directed RNA polymerase specialized sigma24 family protein